MTAKLPYLLMLCIFLLAGNARGENNTMTFEVDMQNAIAKGFFNPATDVLDVAGTFNGWGDPANVLTPVGETGIYVFTTAALFEAGQNIEFKFRVNANWDNAQPGANIIYTITDGQNSYSHTWITLHQINWANLQWPQTIELERGDAGSQAGVYGQVYIDNITSTSGATAGLQAWIGFNAENTDPATWDQTVQWFEASFHAQTGNNDEFMTTITGQMLEHLIPGTYYYVFRYRYGSDDYVYGGSGGPWDGTNNSAGTLTLTGDIISATIDPAELYRYNNWPTPDQDITITWNDAGQLTGMYVFNSGDDTWMPVSQEFYGLEDNGDGTAVFTLFSSEVSAKDAEGNRHIISDNNPWKLEFNIGDPAIGNALIYTKTFFVEFEVEDSDGNPLPMATIELLPYDGNNQDGQIWDDSNNPVFEVVASLDYTYTIEAPDFIPVSGTLLQVNRDLLINIAMDEEPYYSMTFNLYMQDALAKGLFDPETDFVEAAGTFNEWGDPTGWVLSEGEEAGLYTFTSEKNFSEGDFLEFKFRFNGNWNINQPHGVSNLQYTIIAGDNSFDYTWQTNHISWVNLLQPSAGELIRGSDQIELNIFGHVGIPNISGSGGPTPGLNAWVGVNDENTDPDTWTNPEQWFEVAFHRYVGQYDQYVFSLNGDMLAAETPGTYYYVYRFQYGIDDYVYAGLGGHWSEETHAGVLTLRDYVSATINPDAFNFDDVSDFDQSGAFTTITWNEATSVADVHVIIDDEIIPLAFEITDIDGITATLHITLLEEEGLKNYTKNGEFTASGVVVFNHGENAAFTITFTNPTWRVSMRVVDKQNQTNITNAGIWVKETDGHYLTDTNGWADFNLPEGDYTIQITAEGFVTVEDKAIRVQSGFVENTFTVEMSPALTLYSLTLAVNPDPAGEVTGAGDYEEGESVSITATPTQGYAFTKWTDSNQAEISTEANFTYTMPATDITLVAQFQPVAVPAYTLTLEAQPAAGGSVNGAGDYEEGESVSITATPTQGYAFIKWTDSNQAEISTEANFMYTMPATDITLIAQFDIADATDNPELSGLEVYPNPTRGQFHIRSQVMLLEYHITDLAGKTVSAGSVMDYDAEFSLQLEPGIYLLRILTGKGAAVRKLQVQ